MPQKTRQGWGTRPKQRLGWFDLQAGSGRRTREAQATLNAAARAGQRRCARQKALIPR